MNCKHKLARFNQKVRSEARLKDLIHPSTIAFIYVVLKYWKEKPVVNVDPNYKSGRKKGGPSILQMDILKDYREEAKKVKGRMDNEVDMSKWEAWWTYKMKKRVARAPAGSSAGEKRPREEPTMEELFYSTGQSFFQV